MKPCTRFNLIRNNIRENSLQDNLVSKEFTIKLDDSRVASIQYQLIGNDTYDLVHSSIPEEYQGLGLGRILADRVFNHIEQTGKNVVITCHFLQKCYQENHNKYSLTVLSNTKK